MMLSYTLVLHRLETLLLFPVNNPELIPSLMPIIVGFIVLELYFGKYKYEELGWNSAVGNSTMLVTTALSLIIEKNLIGSIKTLEARTALFILIAGLIILIFDYFHIWRRKIAFNISSAFVTYLTSYVLITVTYSSIPIGIATIMAAVLFGGILFLVFNFL
ncbi:MAG: hypothetical protein MUP58_02060 [Candidatus Nanohaloarchaeota archaeon QJJ-9]|nr:hypothetical protein [Candidatus Nanohaloarchaeota archaeon QJJ-9]